MICAIVTEGDPTRTGYATFTLLMLLCVQVMDPKKTANEKVIKDRKPDHTLISFFGDHSYGWFPKGRDIIPFDKHYAAKSKQPASKKVQLSLSSLALHPRMTHLKLSICNQDIVSIPRQCLLCIVIKVC